ncbi:MAG: hypothetical protein H0X51_05255 [Parachlamydiaceae bacterium]|nr:hypothetical protein [Parachlamydiaceae bacterium]
MHTKYFLHLLLVLTSFSCCAAPVSYDELSLEQIFANQDSFVKKVNDNKVYLQEERIYWDEDNIFLLLNEKGDLAALPSLESDCNGFFISLNFNRLDPYLNTCSGCGRKYLVVCQNPECTLKQRRQQERQEETKRWREEREKDQRRWREERKQKK